MGILLVLGVMVAVAIGIYLLHCAFAACRNLAARRVLRKDTIAYAVMILAFVALWIIGNGLETTVQPAFGILVPCLSMLLAVLLPLQMRPANRIS